MSAAILAFPDKMAAERAALIAQARSDYERIFPTSAPDTTHSPKERNRERIDTIRRRDNFKFRHDGPGADDPACDDLIMDHVDTGIPSDSPYHAPERDPAWWRCAPARQGSPPTTPAPRAPGPSMPMPSYWRQSIEPGVSPYVGGLVGVVSG